MMAQWLKVKVITRGNMFHPLSRQQACVLSYDGVRTQGLHYPSPSPKSLQKSQSAALII